MGACKGRQSQRYNHRVECSVEYLPSVRHSCRSDRRTHDKAREKSGEITSSANRVGGNVRSELKRDRLRQHHTFTISNQRMDIRTWAMMNEAAMNQTPNRVAELGLPSRNLPRRSIGDQIASP